MASWRSRTPSPSGLTYVPLGDSITQGGRRSGGYRCALQAKLDAGYDASAVGLSGFLDRWTVTDCSDKLGRARQLHDGRNPRLVQF